ncbi:DNA cytosine methyltransferase [Streptomyces sp. NBC_00249]|uniref:DNA cytosine methyltransferase n=1 Tax=unclassified Streptomyces TaxID=2593676 RepID=UPI0022549A40|nr:DNA cytosine methyltransferase [Streptomyces sp. NBC_00249]MCX5198010.1 DNA cytosine methyltransferase [Streptomyces sp. NBC_00249]
MTSTTPTVSAVDLFCGVGGLTHGLVRSGIDVRVGVDLDPSSKYPYEANNPSRFVERDVNSLTSDELASYIGTGGDYSLLAGCAPCQPFSTYSQSGRSKKRGLDWQLVSKFGELVADVQPDLVTMENVAQLADHDVFEQFLGNLKGYDVQVSVVECTKIGIPQSRKRLVVVASKLGIIDFDPTTGGIKPRTVRQEIGKLPPIRAGEQHPSDPLHAASGLSEMNMRRIKASKPGGTWRDWDPELLAACHRKATGATYPSVYGRMEWDAPAPTITTQCFGYGNGRFGHPTQDRAISLREAAMIQTFPRDYKFLEADEPVRFNRLGRLIGNAVPVRLGEVIGDALIAHVRKAAAGELKPLSEATSGRLF